MAKQQTQGKGQRGNQWKSLIGGLYISLYLEIDLSTDNLAHLTLVSAYGIVQELRKYNVPLQIKWLNDLILEKKKIGGILCETKIFGNRIKKVVIGVGINYQNPIPEGAINIINFSQRQKNIKINSIEKLAKIVIDGLFNGYSQYYNLGVNFIVENYNKLLNSINEKVLIQRNKGIILGVNQQGNLKVSISSLNANSNIYFSPTHYHISYQKEQNNCYILREKELCSSKKIKTIN